MYFHCYLATSLVMSSKEMMIILYYEIIKKSSFFMRIGFLALYVMIFLALALAIMIFMAEKFQLHNEDKKQQQATRI